MRESVGENSCVGHRGWGSSPGNGKEIPPHSPSS